MTAQTVNVDLPIAEFPSDGKLEFDFGDGTPKVTKPAATTSAEHTYAQDGHFTLTIRALDNNDAELVKGEKEFDVEPSEPDPKPEMLATDVTATVDGPPGEGTSGFKNPGPPIVGCKYVSTYKKAGLKVEHLEAVIVGDKGDDVMGTLSQKGDDVVATFDYRGNGYDYPTGTDVSTKTKVTAKTGCPTGDIDVTTAVVLMSDESEVASKAWKLTVNAGS